MNKNKFGQILFFLLALSFANNGRADFDPSVDWHTITTEHFYIHYQDGAEALGNRAAVVAETVYPRITERFDWVPWSRTHIIINDRIQQSNGSAIPFFDKVINVWSFPPDDIKSLEDHDGWLETVIEHEFVHIVHLDKVSGVPRVFRSIFGTVPPLFLGIINPSFPNITQPRWFVEGLATYVETHGDSKIGRGQSSYYEMLMRLDVASKIKSIHDVNALRREWPGGTIWYLYGVHFFQFIEEKYGEAKVKELIEEYSDNWLGYFINTNANTVFGKSLSRLWDEFEVYLQKRYEPVIDRVKQQGEVQGTRLTRFGFETRNLKMTSDGTLYFVRDDHRRIPSIMRLRPNVDEPEYVAEINGDARYDVADDGTIVAAQFQVNRNYNLYYELFLREPDGSWKQLTSGGRYTQVAFDQPTGRILAIKTEGMSQRLDVLDLKGEVIDTLWRSNEEMTVGAIDLSPNGKTIVASIWRKHRGWNLENFDLGKREWSVIVESQAIESQPQFDSTGEFIYYSADTGGIYNVHRYDIKRNLAETMTRLMGGAFYPVAYRDKLFYVGAHKGGFDVYALNNSKVVDTIKLEKTKIVSTKTETTTLVQSPTVESTGEYIGLAYLLPRWWLPSYSTTKLGSMYSISTVAYDPLQFHTYIASVAWFDKFQLPLWSFDYEYAYYYPKFHFTADRSYLQEYLGSAPMSRIRSTDLLQAYVTLPYNRFRSKLEFHVGGTYRTERDYKKGDGANYPLDDAYRSYAGAAITYDNSTTHSLSISKQEGRNVRLILEGNDYFKNVKANQSLIGDWREYVYMGRSSVFALRILGGMSQGNMPAFQLGGSMIDTSTPDIKDFTQSPLFGQRRFEFRGYNLEGAGFIGDRMFLGSAEIRFPLGRLQKSLMSPPIGLTNVQGSLFYETGSAWSQDNVPKHLPSSAGFDLGFRTQFFYFFEVLMRLGVVYAFDRRGYDYTGGLEASF